MEIKGTKNDDIGSRLTRLATRLERLFQKSELLGSLAIEKLQQLEQTIENLAADSYTADDPKEKEFLLYVLFANRELSCVDSVSCLHGKLQFASMHPEIDSHYLHLGVSVAIKGVKIQQLFIVSDCLPLLGNRSFLSTVRKLLEADIPIYIDQREHAPDSCLNFILFTQCNKDMYGVIMNMDGSLTFLSTQDLVHKYGSFLESALGQPSTMFLYPLSSLCTNNGPIKFPCSQSCEIEIKLSIQDLFSNKIILRDLEPKDPSIRGLSALRKILGLPAHITPRKNDPDYAKVVESFAQDVSHGRAKHVFYVGDSAFNDGNVIKNLAHLGNYKVLGYLCNEQKNCLPIDFTMENIIFSTSWSHIPVLVSEGLKRKFPIDNQLVAFFDLDQTVYAAKGRADEPLRLARLEAIHKLLLEAMGPDRYYPKRADRLFREFDRDDYHHLTKDNLDYVVFLVLIGCLGFYDAEEIKHQLTQPDASILTMIEDVYQRVERRRGTEELKEVWPIVRELYHNARSGDETPSRRFRKEECLATVKWMRGTAGATLPDDDSKSITITYEVANLVNFLSRNGANVVALSDRPPDAAEIVEPGTGVISIFDIKMPLEGTIVSQILENIA